MTIEEIKNAVRDGKRVFWSNDAYEVKKDSIGQWLVICNLNNYCCGLHGLEGTKHEDELNWAEEKFFIA